MEMSQVSSLDLEESSLRIRSQADYIKEALGGTVTGLSSLKNLLPLSCYPAQWSREWGVMLTGQRKGTKNTNT